MSLHASITSTTDSSSTTSAPNENDIADGTDQMDSPSANARDENSSSQPPHTEEKVEEFTVPYDPDEHGFRKIIRNFSPSWFVVTMGTGAVSTLLYEIPYTAQWLHILSIIAFVLNIVLWISFFVLSCIRYALYPEIFGALLRNPVQRLFLGTVPTGLSTIINMIVLLCVPPWGQGMAILAWVLWWINIVVAIFLCFYLTLVCINVHKIDLSGMTSLWLLPVLPTVIASTTGGLIASVLSDPQHQYWTLIISYVLWGIGVPLALMILVLYFHRLMVHEMLEKVVIVSAFLPVGPFGLAGFSIFLLGKNAITIFPENGILPHAPNAGQMLYVFGFVVALTMWGFGLLWLFFAIATIYSCRKFPFNMGWWSFTFPLGVFVLSTIQLGNELDSSFFKVLGTVLSVIVFILWIIVAIGTIQNSLTRETFYSPCLNTDMKLKELKIKRNIARTTGARAG